MSNLNGPVAVIPSVLYSDANAGIAWLTSVLGFREHAVYRGTDGVVEHAELRFGGAGMVMLGTAGRNPETAAWNALPRELGDKSTGGVYLIVPNCAPVWERAQAARAEVLMPLRTMSYGGQAFAVRDMDGHIWSFGEYSPWTSVQTAPAE